MEGWSLGLTGQGLLPLGQQLREWGCRKFLLIWNKPGEQGTQKTELSCHGPHHVVVPQGNSLFLHIYFLHLAVPRPAV